LDDYPVGDETPGDLTGEARMESPRRRDPRSAIVDAPTGEPVPDSAPGRRRIGSNRRWRNVALALGLIVAALAGATGRLLLGDLNPSISGPTNAAPTPSPSLTTTAPTATASPSPTPTPSPTITVLSAPPASVTFRDLMLDAPGSSSLARTFSFTSDGQGSVSAKVIAAAPRDDISMCIQVNGNLPFCNNGATPGFEQPTPPGDHADWVVTVSNTKAGSTPIVDLAFTWPTLAPTLTISHGRFQGLPNPDSLRGFTVQFQTRAAGQAGLAASWPPASAKAALVLTDITKLPATKVDQASYSGVGSINPPYSHQVDSDRTYQLVLSNSMTDSGRPDLTATISFP
jgi:hypothetical protein